VKLGYFDKQELARLTKRLEKSGLTVWDVLLRGEISFDTAYNYFVLGSFDEAPSADCLHWMEGVILNSMYDCFSQHIEFDAKRLEELRSMSYQDYLQSPEWKVKRKLLIRLYKKCQLCGNLSIPGETCYHVHHNDYSNRPLEKPTDLLVLCNFCHAAYHARVKRERAEWKRLRLDSMEI